MHVALGCDHRGLKMKRAIMAVLASQGHVCQDFGCYSEESVDYPDLAGKVGRAVASEQAEHGILICSTGIGMSIAANKIPGIRAALCWSTLTAQRAREHNNANVLCLGGDLLEEELALDIVATYLSSEFQGGRHQRRVDKIRSLETG